MAADQPRIPKSWRLRPLIQTQSSRMLWYRKVDLYSYAKGHPYSVMPVTWHCRVFDMVHSLSHSGLWTSVMLVGCKFVWAGLCKEAVACVACQCAKVHQYNKALLKPFANPTRRFDHVDLCPWPRFYTSAHSWGSNHQVVRGDSFRPP